MISKNRILILTPTALPTVTGNAMTVERWRRSLKKKDFVVEVAATDPLRVADLLGRIDRFQPDLIHLHHAFRAGALLLDPRIISLCTDLPLIVSPAGTDIYLDLENPERKETVIRILDTARAIVAQDPGTERRLKKLLPQKAGRIIRVPKASIWLGRDPYDLRTVAGCHPEDVLFFLPAGIRPVKGNLETLMAMKGVRAHRPNVRVIFAGPDLDSDYALWFKQEVARLYSFARWIPLIPPEAMCSAFEAADVVLNTSFSEALSNSLMEAIAAGRPILASDIPGNRLPVLGENGDLPAGYLFNPLDREDLIRHAIKLIDDHGMRQVFSQAGRSRAAQWPTPEEEAEGLMAAYETALAF